MVPAQERFDAAVQALVEADDRLVVDLELTELECPLQLCSQLEPLDDALVHRGLEQPVAPLAVALRHVHGHVRIAEELLGVPVVAVAVAVAHADADACVPVDVLAVDLDRRLVGAGDAVEQDRELVTTEPRDRVRRPNRHLEPARDLLEHLVARGVAEAVVDGLEVVEVDEHDADESTFPQRAAQRVLHAVGEKCSVREACHRVVERLVRKLVFEGLALADVTRVEDDAVHELVVQEVRVPNLELQPASVTVLERAFHRMHPGAAVLPFEHLGEARPVGLGEQAVEAAALDLRRGVAERAFDRRALIRHDAVRVEDRDQVRRVRDKRAEAGFALPTMKILCQQCAFERKRDLRRKRIERTEQVVAKRMSRRDDERPAHLVANRQRQEENRAVSLQLERLVDAPRQRRERDGSAHAEHRPDPAGSLVSHDPWSFRTGRHGRFTVRRQQDDADGCARPDDLSGGSDNCRIDLLLACRRDERDACAAQRELPARRPLLLANEPGHTRDDKEEQDRRRADDDEHVHVVDVLREMDPRRDQAREREQREAEPRQAASGVDRRLFERAHRRMERGRSPQHEIGDPPDVVDQLMVVRAFEQRVVVGAVRCEDRHDARDQQVEGRRALARVDREPDCSSEQEDVAERIRDRHAFRERRETRQMGVRRDEEDPREEREADSEDDRVDRGRPVGRRVAPPDEEQ